MSETRHYYEIADQLGLPNERIGQIKQIDNCLFFRVNGVEYSAKIGRDQKVKANSVRRDK